MAGFRRLLIVVTMTFFIAFPLLTEASRSAAQSVSFGWGNNRASTAGESYARGMSDVIRSSAEARSMDASTISKLQSVQAQYYQNRVLAAQAFVDQRRIRDQYREDRHQADRYKLASYLGTKQLKPLASSEYHQASGKISWPPILDLPQFEKARKFMDDIFAKRATTGALTSQEYLQCSTGLKKWRQSLTQFNETFSSKDLQEAARFLNRLDVLLKSETE